MLSSIMSFVHMIEGRHVSVEILELTTPQFETLTHDPPGFKTRLTPLAQGLCHWKTLSKSARILSQRRIRRSLLIPMCPTGSVLSKLFIAWATEELVSSASIVSKFNRSDQNSLDIIDCIVGWGMSALTLLKSGLKASLGLSLCSLVNDKPSSKDRAMQEGHWFCNLLIFSKNCLTFLGTPLGPRAWSATHELDSTALAPSSELG